MTEKTEQKKPLSWWRRILLCLIVIAIVMLCGLMLLSYVMGRRLGAEIVKISEAGEPLKFADFQSDIIRSDTADDATQSYTEALSSMRPDKLSSLKSTNTLYRSNLSSLPTDQVPEDLYNEVAQLLVDFQSALEKLDKGAGVPLYRFDSGIVHGIQEFQNRLVRIQTAVFLLSLRTLDLIRQGEGDAASSSVISLLKMTRMFDLHPTLVSHASKTSLLLLACADIQLLLEHSRPSEDSLVKLQTVLLETIPVNALERVFLAERVFQIEMARNFIPEDITLRYLEEEVPDLPERLSVSPSFLGRLRVQWGSVKYLQDMVWLINSSRRPWPEPVDIIVTPVSELERKPSRIISSGAAFVNLTAQALSIVRCALLAIEVERYRITQGKLPESLDDVESDYIDTVLLDPFSGKRLNYSRAPEAYVVYSVGINRQDDGGLVIREAGGKTLPDQGIRIRQLSEGQ
ncbi:MAG: hypothetical protein ACYS8Y_11500 [Planctomycetota bacterium]